MQSKTIIKRGQNYLQYTALILVTAYAQRKQLLFNISRHLRMPSD